MALEITASEPVFVNCRPEDVWDFTQDHARRHEWDASVRDAAVIEQFPVPRVRVCCAGGLRPVFQYRQFDRPLRTSLAMEEVRSPPFVGGGGSWTYEAEREGTRWTQTNTLVMKSGCWRRLVAPLVRRHLVRSARKTMERAKGMLEASG